MREALISFPMLGENFVVNPPYAVNIGSFSIYFYGIIIACGLMLGVAYGIANCNRIGIDADAVYDLVIWAVICAIIGARAYYCIFNWSTYAADPMRVFAIRDGGLAIYGGVIGAIVALYVRCRMKRWSIFPALDIMSFGLFIGQSIGRWGNFFNREAFGYETDIFCRMGLTLGEVTTYVHPTFLYESLWNAFGFVFMHFYSKRHHRYRGQFFLMYLAWYGLGRALIEGLRTDSLWLIPDVIRVSQLLAAVTCLAAVVLLVLNGKRVSEGKAPVFGRRLDADDMIILGPAPEEDAEAPETKESELPEETVTDESEQE